VVELVFWIALFGSVYSYFLYPFFLKLTPGRSLSVAQAPNSQPRVSLIVTAHNEESRIVRKLENCLAIDYPNLEIIVASDASTDATDSVVRSYGDRGVSLARADERKGKEYAQLQAIKVARGEILVFSDVATDIRPDALHKLVSYFQDPVVGAVSSEDRFITRDGKVAGEGAYVRYEMWLRRLESEHAGLVGLSGSFFAARKSVCQKWDIAAPSDFNTALNCATQKLVAVSATDVLGYYQDVTDSKKEYERKIRTIIRGLTALERHLDVLNPFKYGWFTFQVVSHKLMRWAVPWFLALLLVTSLTLVGKGLIYDLAATAQGVFYACVLLAYARPVLRNSQYFKIPFFFIQVNLAIAHATVRFLTGTRMTVWTPSKR
jgi:glycosyltransferase involved in cell wall biosynthesis